MAYPIKTVVEPGIGAPMYQGSWFAPVPTTERSHDGHFI
jgi:hypothetical protein